ncbi:MAG TPA: hypothetical protein PLR44_13620 [Thermomicrobiales bacterium]|nr:hypothetical protein [Thermomicrobiales bacterium]
MTRSDQPAWIELQSAIWIDTAVSPDTLSQCIREIIIAADVEFGNALATQFIKLHKDLQIRHRLSHQEASLLLSYGHLIASLAKHHRMSAAQIRQVIISRHPRLNVTWRSVQLLLIRLDLSVALHDASVRRLWNSDQERAFSFFADADIETSSQIVDILASRLEFPEPLSPVLKRLHSDGDPFLPYLQMLYFTCTVAEFFDHDASVPYEFSPRGIVANWLFDQFPNWSSKKGNPFLNNAKATGRLDMDWASNRVDNQGDAQALARLVLGLGGMGFTARREVAALLRMWIHRLLRLYEESVTVLPTRVTANQAENLLTWVSEHETASAGVIEQRVVDYIASRRHQPSAGWATRGLGDPVNASNTSRRKLGDIDFQNTELRSAVAYEAHAGRLSSIYLEDHLRTLRRILPQRAEEWQPADDSHEWTIELVFIGHEVANLEPRVVDVDGRSVQVRFETMRDAIRSDIASGIALDTFVNTIIMPLNERRTPNSVRDAVLSKLSFES